MKTKHLRLMQRAYVILFFCFMYLPIAYMIVFSFNQSKGYSLFTGFTLKWYSSLFHNSSILHALWVSIEVALLSAVIATVLGTAASLGIASMSRRSRLLVTNITYIPVVNPEIITGISLMLLFVAYQRFAEGVSWLPDTIMGFPTLLIAHIAFNVPYVIFNVSPSSSSWTSNCMRQLWIWAAPQAGLLQGHPAGDQPRHPVGLPHLPDLLHDDFMISYFTAAPWKRCPSPSIHDPQEGQPGDLRTVHHHVRGDPVHHSDFQRHGKPQLPPRPEGAERGGRVMKRFAVLLLTLALAVCCTLPAFAAGTIEVNEDVSVSGDYDWTRFKGQNMTLNVYNWGEYISNGSDDSLDVVSAFEDLTGIKVNYTTFDSNESMYAKLKSGAADYDVVIPSDYMVAKMIAEGMLKPLNYDNIPNFQKIDAEYRNPDYDPQNAYTVPYMLCTTGIIYNTTMVDKAPTSWADLWDEQYAGNILMFNNSRDAYAIAAFKSGHDINPQSTEEVDEVVKELKAQKPLVQAYVMDEIFDKMIGGEAAIGVYYSGDAITMIDDNPDLAWVFPEEGSVLSVDCMAIPATSEHQEAAEMFINFMCETDIGKANAEYIGYTTPMESVREVLDEDLRDSEIAYPPEELAAKERVFTALSDDVNSELDVKWSEMKSYDEGGSSLLFLSLLAAMVALACFNIWRKLRKKSRNQY